MTTLFADTNLNTILTDILIVFPTLKPKDLNKLFSFDHYN